MRETLMHVSEELSPVRRQRLCNALGALGASCDTKAHSTKPHLVFIAYDEHALGAGDLVRTAAREGCSARLVDL